MKVLADSRQFPTQGSTTLARRARALPILLREAARAATVPFRLLGYLPRRHAHRRRARTLLAEERDPHERAARNAAARASFRSLLGDQAGSPARVFVACGEASGEAHARALVTALRERVPGTRVAGFGGAALEGAGVRLVCNLVDDAVMGVTAVLARLPFYLDVVASYLEELERARPDLVVLVDNPGLNMVLAREAKHRGIPVLYYICPQYWAWGPWRMRRFRRSVDGAIAILPFEPPLFENAGVPTAFAGSPLLAGAPELAPEPREPLVCLLPGSRRAEIDKQATPMLELFARFRARHPDARAVLPQTDARKLERIRAANTGRLEGVELVEGDPFPLLARARIALVKSGTSALQCAVARCPMVVVYKLGNPLETLFAHNFLSVPWIAGPNLVLGREAIAEFCFRSPRRWPRVEAALAPIFEDGEARARQLAALDEIRARLSGDGATAEALRWILPR